MTAARKNHRFGQTFISADSGNFAQMVEDTAYQASQTGKPYFILVLDRRSPEAEEFHLGLCKAMGYTPALPNAATNLACLALGTALLPQIAELLGVESVPSDIPVFVWNKDNSSFVFPLNNLRR